MEGWKNFLSSTMLTRRTKFLSSILDHRWNKQKTPNKQQQQSAVKNVFDQIQLWPSKLQDFTPDQLFYFYNERDVSMTVYHTVTQEMELTCFHINRCPPPPPPLKFTVMFLRVSWTLLAEKWRMERYPSHLMQPSMPCVSLNCFVNVGSQPTLKSVDPDLSRP